MSVGSCYPFINPHYNSDLTNTIHTSSTSHSSSSSNSSHSSNSSYSSNSSSSNSSLPSSSSPLYGQFRVVLSSPAYVHGVSVGHVSSSQSANNRSSAVKEFTAFCNCIEDALPHEINTTTDKEHAEDEERRELNAGNKTLLRYGRCNHHAHTPYRYVETRQGLKKMYEEEIVKGEFAADGPRFQTFFRQSAHEKGKYQEKEKINSVNNNRDENKYDSLLCDSVTMDIHSNHGNNKYTCLYRVLVHPYS